MSSNKFGDLYTSGKDGDVILSCYNLEALQLDKALCRINNFTENGVALTIGLKLTKPFKSTVSKSAKEKGTQEVEYDKGDVLIFQVNSSIKDDRKPDEVNGRCQTILNALTGKMKKGDETIQLHDHTYVAGDIIRFTFDGQQIPLKGLLNAKSLKNYLGDIEDSIIYLDPLSEAEINELNEDDSEVYEALKKAKVPQRGNYQQRKSVAEIFDERLKLVTEMMADPKGVKILQVASFFGEGLSWIQEEGCEDTWEANSDAPMTAQVIANLLRC
jgi:hypothetical protein